MARKVVLDANVIVAWLDGNDTLAQRAQELLHKPHAEQVDLVVLVFIVAEAVSVLCRRATQRKASPPDLARALHVVRTWAERGFIRFTSGEPGITAVLDVIERSNGQLNYNDAVLVCMQADNLIGDVASFDSSFDAVPEFKRVS